MTDDLVQRLKGHSEILTHDKGKFVRFIDVATCTEAIDRIEQLEREKAVVSDLWEQQKEIALDYLTDCNKAADRVEVLEAENQALRHDLERQMTIANEQVNEVERLREALKRIQHFSPAHMWRAPDIKVIISAALQEQSK